MKVPAPEIIYAAFSFIQITIDVLKGLYKSAGIKLIISLIVIALLRVLFKMGFLMVAWFIVLVPFLFMAFTTSVILYKMKTAQCIPSSYIKKTIVNNPRYEHGYDHLYKYTVTPVKMRVEMVKNDCESDTDTDTDTDTNTTPTHIREQRVKIVKPVYTDVTVPVSYKNHYSDRSDPSYESFGLL